MLKRLLILTAILVAVLALLRERGRLDEGRGDSAASGLAREGASHRSAGDEPVSLPTKASSRGDTGPRATHSPSRLKEFFLPEVEIDGLPLEAALRKLQSAYEDVCRESGEVPLRLGFSVPPGQDRPLQVKLGRKTLDASIRRLAAVSGLKVARQGASYVFTAPEESGRAVKRTFRVPPDYFNAPGEIGDPFEAPAPPSKMAPADFFAAQGVNLDPATRLTYDPATGVVAIDTTRAADEAAVGGLTDLAAGELPLQHQFKTAVFALSSDTEWNSPDLAQLDAEQVQALMRTLAQTKGADLMTLPSITARGGEQATIEIVNELVTPVAGSPDTFETNNVGVVLDVTPSPLGFGHQVGMDFSITTGDIDPYTGAAVIHEDAAITDSSYTGDGAARLHIQTHPDGTRTVMLVTPTLIDATGRPLRAEE